MSRSVVGGRKEKKAETRKAIKTAAEECFGRLGYAKTGISDIAEAAGVAHGTFYVHFPNKGAVVDELLGDFNDGLARRLGPVFAARDRVPLEATVRAAAEIFLDYWSEQRGFVETFAQRSALGLSLDELRDGVNPPMVQLLEASLPTAFATDAASPDWRLVTQGLLSMWLRIGLQFVFGAEVERATAIDTLTLMSLGAVRAVACPDPTETTR